MSQDPNVAAKVSAEDPKPTSKLVYFLALFLVLVGMLNAMPGIPGMDNAARAITGLDWVVVRKFPYEYFYPLIFFWMMLIVALKHSMFRDWANRSSARRNFGLFMDVALVVAAAAISITYLMEIDSVCIVDQFTGERAELIAKSLIEEREFAELYGLPVPDSVEDPQCINTTGGFLVLIVGVAVIVFLAYNVKVWAYHWLWCQS